MSRHAEVRAAGASLRFERRPALVLAVLMPALLAACLVSLALGEFPIAPADLASALLGGADQGTRFVVVELRLPRIALALMVGLALGVAGAVFQDVSGNPLASPDLIGVSAGASLAAVWAIVLIGADGIGAPLAALAGGLAAGVLLYALAWRSGVRGYRLVLVGIGLTTLFQAGVAYVLTKGAMADASRAYVWLVGSLNGRGWEQAWPLALALLGALPATLWLCRALGCLQLGDELARALGARVEPARLGLLGLAVVLTATAVSAAGPIVFVAFAAPHLARGLGRTASPAATAALAGAIGALAVVLADTAGRLLFSPTEIPAGIVTSVLAAPYLMLLLRRADRAGAVA